MKSWWRYVGLLISAVAVWWLVEKSGIDWSDAWQHARHANLGLLVLASAVGTMMFPLRAIRWTVILEPVAPELSFAACWRATAIGFMVNNISSRGGEVARPLVLSYEEPSIPFSTAFASLFVDRAFDFLVILLLLLVAIFEPTFPRDATLWGRPVQWYAMYLSLIVAALAVALYTMVFFPDHLLGLWKWVAHRVAPRFHEPGERILRRFAEGLSVLRHPGRFLRIFVWTVLHWLTQALAFWIAFKAIGVPAGFFAALFVQSVIAIAVAIPSSPGFIGVFEKVSQIALVVYGVSPNVGAAWAISYHVVSLIPITVIGLFYVGRLGLTLGQLGSAAPDVE
jgi:glycosyltransferase 2 family protein